MSKLQLPRISAAATRKGACDRLEIRFEGQRRIGEFEAIRSASLLRKSILEKTSGHLRRLACPYLFKSCASAAIRIKSFSINRLYFMAVRRLTAAHAPYGGISLRIALEAKLPNIYSGNFPASWRPPENLKGSQVSGDVGRIEYRPGERPDGAERSGVRAPPAQSQRRIVKVRPEHPLGDPERLRADRGLPPADHLRIKPGSLRRFRPGGAFPSHQQITAAFAHRAVRRNLETAVERSQDHICVDADAFRPRQHTCCFGAVFRLLDEFGGARCRPDQPGQNLRVLLGPVLPDGKHLLRRAHQNVGDEMQDMSDAEIDRDGIPGRADAERIDVTAGKA